MARVERGKTEWPVGRMGALWGARIFRTVATWFLLFGIVFAVETGKNRGAGVAIDDLEYLTPLFVLMTAVVMYGTSLFTLHLVKIRMLEKISEQELDQASTMVRLVVDIVAAIVLVVIYHFVKPILAVDTSLSFAISYLFWLCINIVTWLLSGVVKISLPVEGVGTGRVVAVRSVKASVIGAHVGLILLAWFIFWYMSR